MHTRRRPCGVAINTLLDLIYWLRTRNPQLYPGRQGHGPGLKSYLPPVVAVAARLLQVPLCDRVRRLGRPPYLQGYGV